MEYGSTLQALFLNELCIHFFFLLPLTDLLSFTRCSDRSSVFLPSATKMPAGQDCSRLAGGKPMASVGTQGLFSYKTLSFRAASVTGWNSASSYTPRNPMSATWTCTWLLRRPLICGGKARKSWEGKVPVNVSPEAYWRSCAGWPSVTIIIGIPRPCILVRTSGCSLWIPGFPSPSRDLELLSLWFFTGNSCGWVWTRPFSSPFIIQFWAVFHIFTWGPEAGRGPNSNVHAQWRYHGDVWLQPSAISCCPPCPSQPWRDCFAFMFRPSTFFRPSCWLSHWAQLWWGLASLCQVLAVFPYQHDYSTGVGWGSEISRGVWDKHGESGTLWRQSPSGEQQSQET